MSKKPYVVVGGGPVGLMLAYYLAAVRKQEVVLVEQNEHLGGLYAGVQTQWGLVDQGVHIPQETGCSMLDSLFFEVLPEENWHLLSGVQRDIAGNIFAGRLNIDSLYPDLRLLPREDYLSCLAGLMDNVSVDHQDFSEACNLRAFLEDRFGEFCVDRVFNPIANKIWRRDCDQLSPWAAKIVHLARVLTHDREMSASLKTSPALDAVIGFPEQLAATSTKLQSRRSLYPKQFGLQGFVDALRSRLSVLGVRLLTSSTVTRFESDNTVVLEIKDLRSDAIERVEASGVVWSSPMPVLAKLLGVSGGQLPDAPLPHRLLHLFLDCMPDTGSLYWLWSYDCDDDLVRVSIPEAYCPDALKGGVHPICVEMHAPEHDVTDEEMMNLAEAQLRARELIAPSTRVLGGKVHEVNRTFFIPTIGNCEAMVASRKGLEARMPENLVLATQDLSAGIFYLSDILRAGVNSLNKD
jgi:protoporphyrinogen oxidase